MKMMKKRSEKKSYKKSDVKKKGGMKTKPQGKGIVKALGQKKTSGNFKKIEAKEGKGAAIGALQNKLAAHRGQSVPYGNKAKGGMKAGSMAMLKRGMQGKKK